MEFGPEEGTEEELLGGAGEQDVKEQEIGRRGIGEAPDEAEMKTGPSGEGTGRSERGVPAEGVAKVVSADTEAIEVVMLLEGGEC